MARLGAATFGVLGTVDSERGVHLVPVVFAVSGAALVVPIDSVKSKKSTRLRRVDNLLGDGRASILVDHRSADWAELWWVRADLTFTGTANVDASWQALLGRKYPQYRPEDTIESLLLFDVDSPRGWRAG